MHAAASVCRNLQRDVCWQPVSHRSAQGGEEWESRGHYGLAEIQRLEELACSSQTCGAAAMRGSRRKSVPLRPAAAGVGAAVTSKLRPHHLCVRSFEPQTRPGRARPHKGRISAFWRCCRECAVLLRCGVERERQLDCAAANSRLGVCGAGNEAMRSSRRPQKP
jgi:hypothetical protein